MSTVQMLKSLATGNPMQLVEMLEGLLGSKEGEKMSLGNERDGGVQRWLVCGVVGFVGLKKNFVHCLFFDVFCCFLQTCVLFSCNYLLQKVVGALKNSISLVFCLCYFGRSYDPRSRGKAC